jgi:chromate transport protein ChrA
MAASGLATLAFDFRWFHRPVAKLAAALSSLRGLWPFRRSAQVNTGTDAIETPPHSFEPNSSDAPTRPTTSELPITEHAAQQQVTNNPSTAETEPRIIPPSHQLPIHLSITWQSGAAIIASFLVTFIVIITLRSTLRSSSPLLYRLFANMYLAGTIIFGGGPVVVPLLREYVVAEGWVTPRDFLIGLALIQAFPGPNFNFAVFLGSLTALKEGGGGGHSSSLAGAVVAWVGIFAPGLVLVHGTMGIWSALRGRRWVKSVLRGVNAGAVGLMYTAVYRIFGVGYIDDGFQAGRSLGDDPWWVAITATSYVGGRYFGIQAPLAIVLGAVLGLLRYAVVSA